MSDIEKLIEQAKALIGEKAILTGGGGLANQFSVVKVIDMEDDRPVLEAPDNLSKDGYFKPILCSWKVLPLKEELKDELEVGNYFQTGKEIRKDEAGMFGSIYDCPVVYEFD